MVCAIDKIDSNTDPDHNDTYYIENSYNIPYQNTYASQDCYILRVDRFQRAHILVILRMKLHSACYNIYDNRKTSKTNKISIAPSLTSQRSKLLREANKRLCAESEPVDFIYTDQHGDTKVRLKTALNNKFAFKFFALEELETIMKN